MSKEQTLKQWGVTLDKATEDLDKAARNILKYVIAEAKNLKNIKTDISTKMNLILSVSYSKYLFFIKDNASPEIYKMIIKSVRGASDVFLKEHLDILEKGDVDDEQ